jgi:hypothetical protein
MKYMDIFTDAVSYFTNIPPDFIKGYLKNYVGVSENNADLLNYIMDVEFPEIEAIVLLNDLKSGSLEATISFFNNSFQVIRNEEQRQAIVN